jgi:hypothetical protein
MGLGRERRLVWGLNIQFGLDQRVLGARLGHAAI